VDLDARVERALLKASNDVPRGLELASLRKIWCSNSASVILTIMVVLMHHLSLQLFVDSDCSFL